MLLDRIPPRTGQDVSGFHLFDQKIAQAGDGKFPLLTGLKKR